MDKLRQLPLNFQHAPAYSRDALVVSPANEEAVALIDHWPDWPAPVMILMGPAGAGKTHLAEIWRSVSGAVALDVKNLSQTMATFDAHAVVIDDVDQANIDENGLFHLINQLRAINGYLLLTSRQFSSAWGVQLPDLASRLRAAPTVKIHEPDDMLLAGVMAKLFADRQIEVEFSVVDYLVQRIERSLATAIRVVDRLDHMALEEQSRITKPLAARAINALDEGQGELDF
ncbi:DnaA regulatory inactivator HdaA [Aquamicrobium segne]|uniref:DnaA regulatory inactivator HdaA n=1 Tax=Aquamicrobium segne TaxID=469547 RepID=A0ABW0GS07_9HYPH